LTREKLLSAVRESPSASIASLARRLKKANLDFSDEELLRLMDELSVEGAVVVRVAEESVSFFAQLGNPRLSWWVYTMLLLSTLEEYLVAYHSPVTLLVVVRQVLGIALLGFFPGYSTFRTIFPKSELTFLERIILSIFLSLLVSIASGTILGTLSLLEASANVIVLTTFTVVMTLLAAYRVFSVSQA
jgi:hypothetical protein